MRFGARNRDFRDRSFCEFFHTIGRIADVQGRPGRRGLRSNRSYARRVSSACASVISPASPASARSLRGPARRTAWASARSSCQTPLELFAVGREQRLVRLVLTQPAVIAIRHKTDCKWRLYKLLRRLLTLP